MAESVHHIKPAAAFPQLFFDEYNLIPLCDDCHEKLGKLQGAERDELQRQWKQILDKRTDEQGDNNYFS